MFNRFHKMFNQLTQEEKTRVEETYRWAYDFDPKDPLLGLSQADLEGPKLSRRTVLRLLAASGTLSMAHVLTACGVTAPPPTLAAQEEALAALEEAAAPEPEESAHITERRIKLEEKKLKFLVLAKFRPEAIYTVGEPEPAAFMAELTAGYEAAIDILEDIGQPDGFFERIYGRTSGGWIGIVQVDSHKELWEKLTGDKAFYTLFEWHIEPLIEVDNTRENRKNIFPLLMSGAGGGW